VPSHVLLTVQVAENLAGPGKIVGVNVATTDLRERVLQLTDDWGVDLVFECSGNHSAAAAAPQLACPGGAMVFVGCPCHPIPLDVGHMQVRELRTESIFRYAHVRGPSHG
jgi:D-xylulose reductase